MHILRHILLTVFKAFLLVQWNLPLRTPLQYGHLYNTDTSTIRAPLPYGHLYNTGTSTIRAPLQYGHLYNTDTSTIRAPLQYGHLYNMDTSTIRTPLYYGQFTWSLRDRNPYKVYFSKTDTSIIRTLFPVICNFFNVNNTGSAWAIS